MCVIILLLLIKYGKTMKISVLDGNKLEQINNSVITINKNLHPNTGRGVNKILLLY